MTRRFPAPAGRSPASSAASTNTPDHVGSSASRAPSRPADRDRIARSGGRALAPPPFGELTGPVAAGMLGRKGRAERRKREGADSTSVPGSRRSLIFSARSAPFLRPPAVNRPRDGAHEQGKRGPEGARYEHVGRGEPPVPTPAGTLSPRRRLRKVSVQGLDGARLEQRRGHLGRIRLHARLGAHLPPEGERVVPFGAEGVDACMELASPPRDLALLRT